VVWIDMTKLDFSESKPEMELQVATHPRLQTEVDD
jgi:hypothetical protein